MTALRIGRGQLRAGTIALAGYKHAAVPVLCAILGRGLRARLLGVPRVEDTRFFRSFLTDSGAVVEGDEDWLIDARRIAPIPLSPELTRRVHGSLYLVPALLGRFSAVRFPGAGGCKIGGGPAGERPVEHVLSVLRAFGARFRAESSEIVGEVDGFRPCDIDVLDYSDDARAPNGPLVSGATKTAILAASLCHSGTSRIAHPYPKTDVTDLLSFLDASGACRVERDKEWVAITPIHRPDCDAGAEGFALIDDISELITFVAASVLHRVPVVAKVRDHERVRRALAPEWDALRRLGVTMSEREGELHILPPPRVRSLDVEATSAGIYSDHQPFFALMLLRGDREATIRDRVWTGRYAYAEGLRQLGADVVENGDELRVRPSQLAAAPATIDATDTRAAAALLLAALDSPGTTLRGAPMHLERGYDGLLTKLRGLGAAIEP